MKKILLLTSLAIFFSYSVVATDLKINLGSLTSQQLEKYGIPIIWD